METTPETAALLGELYERAAIVTELDGPQLEAWVSGLFPVFDDQATVVAFIDHCAQAASERGALLVKALGELTTGLDPSASARAQQQKTGQLPPWADTIGASTLTGAWSVTARFGRSIVLGFDNQGLVAPVGDDEPFDDPEAPDLRHSILAEFDDNGVLADLQLTGPAKLLVDEATDEGDRVVITELAVEDAVATIADAWPTGAMSAATMGAGFDANQQFVRRRILASSGRDLPRVEIVQEPVDVRRGMTDAEYLDANRAALSTLQAAVGLPDTHVDADVSDLITTWVAIVRGDVDDVSARERDALLWLEWADWLGAGIGMFRAGADTAVDGTTLVDYVNRCPEVSSSIDKADREYAEWAFDVALDLLQDQGVITDDRRLSSHGHESLRPGLVAAWSPAGASSGRSSG